MDHFWPSLLKIPGFLLEFITPIVKATKGRQELAFYTIPEYEQWKQSNEDGRGWTIKYYKGLGTSTAADAKKYFQAMVTHRKTFSPVCAEDRQLVDMAFNKKRADERKDWLKTCTPDTFLDHASSEAISISDFVNKELILFSQADNVRSIPSMLDGLKPGQRKIMFGCFKRKLKGEIKVMQLAGYVSEHAAYHHGEASLCQTIVGLAQDYVGSNNLNLLQPNGQFGTRLQGGKDAASPRYIFTGLSSWARVIFRPEDDALLKYLNDDGQSIEPEWYMPILPMVLVNGSEGIGTGWSTSIPSYNPGDIGKNLLRLMNGQECEAMHPWYSGFRGTIEPLDESCTKYKVAGTWRKLDDTTLEITELPVGTWTQSYKEFLEGLITATEGNFGLKDYKEYHTDSTVRFVLHLTEAGMEAAEKEGIEKRFKLSTTLSLSNLVCFDTQGRIKKFTEGPNQILRDFYDLRLTYYQKRKDHLADQLTREWTILSNKARFIKEIVEGKLVVQNKKKAEVVAELTARGYHNAKNDPKENGAVAEVEADENTEATHSGYDYDYLLKMPIYSLTRERIQQLETDCQSKEAALNDLLARQPKDLWRSDLDEFLSLWNQHETGKNTQIAALASSTASGGSNGGAKSRKNSGSAASKKAASATATCAVVAAKRYISDDEDEDEVEYGESESDFSIVEVKKPAKKETAKQAAKELKPAAAPKKPAAKRTKPAPIPTESGPLDGFIKRSKPSAASQPAPNLQPVNLIADDDELDLPLAERIARMLARKAATQAVGSSGTSSVAAPRHVPKAVVAAQRITIMDDEDESDEIIEDSPDQFDDSDGDDDLPTAHAAVAKAKSKPKPVSQPVKASKPKAPPKKRSPIVDSDDEEDEDVFDPSDDDVYIV